MKIILKDKSGNYNHLVTLSPVHIQLKERIKATLVMSLDSDGLELKPTKQAKLDLLMDCLRHVETEIDDQLRTEYFNVVRLLTVIDDLYNTIADVYENELARAFINESFRLLLTKFDLNKDLQTSLDYGRLDLYPAYPVSGGVKQRIQRSDITEAAAMMGVTAGNFYPYNYEFLKFGSYSLLKEAFYSDLSVHDREFILHEQHRSQTRPENTRPLLSYEEPTGNNCCNIM